LPRIRQAVRALPAGPSEMTGRHEVRQKVGP
jgi:hypothetical protein